MRDKVRFFLWRQGGRMVAFAMAGQWLVTQDPMLIAADNCCVEVRPSEAVHYSLAH
jgi:hypothetical protein